jgi:hypothetical protein
VPSVVPHADEQERLRREYEGEIHIEAPKDPEVDPKIYRDVEPLLFQGFLTMPVEINGAYFVFKSLNHHEFGMLRLSGGLRPNGDLSRKFWDTFLAYGVFMIDGQNILPERDQWIPEIAGIFAEYPDDARKRIIRHMSEINRRASDAIVLTESYNTENYSRYRWAQLKSLDMTQPSATGFAGTERLGLNWGQLMWRALNYYEDLHEATEREWENAKFIGSCFAGKGLQKIYHQDQERRKKEREERFSRKDVLLRRIVLGEKISDEQKQHNGAVLVTARTAQELAEQLEKDLRGEKDWHDEIIQAHERRVRDNLQTRHQQMQVIAAERDEEFGPKSIIGGTAELQGLSPAEVQERVTHRKQYEAQQLARQMVRPELHDPKTRTSLERWGLTDTEVNVDVAETTRDTAGAVPIRPPRQGGKPFGRR